MLPLILAARAALPVLGRAVAGRAAGAAASEGASSLLSPAQFGAGMITGSHTGTSNSSPSAPDDDASNPVFNR
ncbi:hypothetical protein ACH427_04105 [Streptomyces sp. NPDC020379]|uniref:hypothetical protein n=1 Tax=Streptomyces sp. NPDC020379 TaxID=3365071 RepID=UPI0037A27B3F